MGKIKEIFGLEDAFTFAEVGKNKAKKMFKNIELQEKVLDVLQNEGKVFATQEKKELVCYYIFEHIKWNDSFEEKNEEKEESYVYKLVEVFWNPQKTHWQETFERTVRANLKEYIGMGMAEAIIWNEEVLVLQKKKKKSFNMTGIGVGIMFGISYGTALDNWTLGIPMAFMWAMVFSMLFNAEESKLVKRGEEDATTQSFERT